MPEWLECVKEQLRIPSKELITAPTAVAYGKDKTEWGGGMCLGRWGGGGASGGLRMSGSASIIARWKCKCAAQKGALLDDRVSDLGPDDL